MYFFRIALRNLFRRRRRTFVAAGVLAIAIIFFLTLDSFLLGMMEVSFSNMIDFETGHLQVASQDFFAEEEEGELPLAETITHEEELEQLLTGKEEVRGFTPVLDFSAELIAGREDFPVQVRGIDIDSFSQIFKVDDYIVQGEFISPGDDGIVLGEELAEMLDLEVGDYYTLHFQDDHGSFNVMQGEIRGIVSTPHPDVNQNQVFTDLTRARDSAALEDSQISKILVSLSSRDDAESLTAELKTELGEDFAPHALTARSYREAEEMLEHLEAWVTLENYVILFLILLIGAIGIINIVVLSALERTREIGIMKALGLKESEIVRIFSLEAGGIGIIGGALGCLLGATIVALLAHFGLDLSVIYGEAIDGLGIPMTGRLYGVWNLSSFILIFLFVFLLTVVASLLPSFWAARKDPIDAIYER